MLQPDIVIPLAGIFLPVVLVPTILVLRHSAKKREFSHRERMKALETGQPVPGEAGWPAAFVCASVGAGVPLGSFLFTWLASITGPHLPAEIWIAPVAVSALALVMAMGMTATLFRATKPSGSAQSDADRNGKPAFDPDAYDVAGSRG